LLAQQFLGVSSMSVPGHRDPAQGWLIFFFVCFAMVVFGLGVFANFTYDVNAPDVPAAGGGGH
jgi:hypothetical protein